MRRCLNCGADSDDAARFCSRCGSGLTETTLLPSAPAQRPFFRTASGRIVIVLVGLVAVGLLAALVFGVGFLALGVGTGSGFSF